MPFGAFLVAVPFYLIERSAYTWLNRRWALLWRRRT
jgi:hypothetical protein